MLGFFVLNSLKELSKLGKHSGIADFTILTPQFYILDLLGCEGM